jgi:RimJ/RimL family protein N-acetyltransferase
MTTTSRLTLRPIEETDASWMVTLLEDDEVGVRMTERLPWPVTAEAALSWIRLRRQPGEHVFAIERNGDMVGAIGLIAEGTVAAIGYWLGRQHRGLGYAREALTWMIGYARTLGVRELLAETFVDNERSQHLLAASGFTHHGTRRARVPNRPDEQELNQYVLTLG